MSALLLVNMQHKRSERVKNAYKKYLE